ncbi:MAG: hypothetical protein IJ837_02505 [Clostridia bacterium]|nr:hypothetical protein [Clostridia bacterium]
MRMKYFDKVKVIRNNEEYNKAGIYAGDVGIIWIAEIRDNTFFVLFDNDSENEWYKEACIKIEDLELVENGNATNEEIAEDLPSDEPWWCIVEDGFIKNLKGEKKNKIPYDYNS